MPEPLIRRAPRAPGRQGGFSLAGVLLAVAVLGVLGGAALRNVRSDLTHSGRDLKRVRADFLAESAVNWCLVELAKSEGGQLPYTRATHSNDSLHALPDFLPNGNPNPRKLAWRTMAPLFPGPIREDGQGWIGQENSTKERSITGADREKVAFKIWYPDDSTFRIIGRGEADGVATRVDFLGRLKDVLIGI